MGGCDHRRGNPFEHSGRALTVMEQITLAGTNHQLAPVAWRERAAVTREGLPATLEMLHASIPQVAILSTCNRIEIYAVADDSPRADNLLHDYFGAELPLYVKYQRDAVMHLFTVATGLDSMLLGEFEILGQVRTAYETAEQLHTLGPILSALFQSAIHTGKRARSETGIGRGAASLAYAAVQLARNELGALRDRCVLVIGAGEMGARVAKNLRADGASAIIVANRTFEHALLLARDLGGRAIHFDEMPGALRDADLVISATGAPHLVLDAATVARAMEARPTRPLCIVDIAVPRDVEPIAGTIANVRLHDLDSLHCVTRETMVHREKEAEQVCAIIAGEIDRFWEWYAERRAVPVIADLHARAEAIRSAELEKTLRRLAHLTDRDRDAVAMLSTSIVSRLLATPTARLKERARQGDGQAYLDAASELFDL